MKNIFTVKNSKIFISCTLFAVNMFMGITLAITNHFLDSILFFFFGVGMFWYIKTIRTQKVAPWYELDNIEGGEL